MMKSYYIYCSLFSLTLLSVNCDKCLRSDEYETTYEEVTNGCYRAAVFEHAPVLNFTDPRRAILANLKIYESAAKKASHEAANIILFPEDGIFQPHGSREDIRPFLEYIPDPGNGSIHNPCNEAEAYKDRPILHTLSCMAKINKIYIAADMGDIQSCTKATDANCPSDGAYQFNSMVAFDAKGFLLSRYHKLQPFYEYYYNPAPKPEYSVFSTPFGRFGMFICFDMIYKFPGTKLVEDKLIDSVLYSTWWFDSFPMLVATHFQQGWAIRHNVNLLAANIHVPQRGSMGSGIYSGGQGALITSAVPDGQAKLLIADLPIKVGNGKHCSSNSHSIAMHTIPDAKAIPYDHHSIDPTQYTYVQLIREANAVRACSKGVCCTAGYSLSDPDDLDLERYFLMVGNYTYNDHYRQCEESCAVVRCNGDGNSCSSFPIYTGSTIFSHISVNATFSTPHAFPFANKNLLELIPKKQWTYVNHENGQVIVNVTNIAEPVISVGLYGRCYERDDPYRQ